MGQAGRLACGRGRAKTCSKHSLRSEKPTAVEHRVTTPEATAGFKRWILSLSVVAGDNVSLQGWYTVDDVNLHYPLIIRNIP